MLPQPSEHVWIQGITAAGKTFRPSDWAERLAGVMSEFHPSSRGGGRRIGYSPWCVPTTENGVKCVVVSRKLKDYQPMAWDFVMNFARDNNLRVIDASVDAAASD